MMNPAPAAIAAQEMLLKLVASARSAGAKAVFPGVVDTTARSAPDSSSVEWSFMASFATRDDASAFSRKIGRSRILIGAEPELCSRAGTHVFLGGTISARPGQRQ